MHSQPRNTAGASTPLRIPLHGCARKQSSLSGLWLFPSWRMGQRGVSVRVPSPRAPREQIWPRNSPSPACTPRSLGKATWAIARSRAGHSRGSQVLQGTGWQRETPKLCSAPCEAGGSCEAELSSCTRAFRLSSSPLNAGTLLLPSEAIPPEPE